MKKHVVEIHTCWIGMRYIVLAYMTNHMLMHLIVKVLVREILHSSVSS